MVFKCKMCGGDIVPIENTNTGKCEYCKSIMTLPNLDNEKIVNLYNRANNLRINSEFDKALELYESILKLDDDELEAHWGVLLCNYGIEYVDDPKTKKKVPTCHRTRKESILSTNEYKKIINKSYGEALELYKEEAQKINEIQKSILKISENEEPYDIFICYKETNEKNGGRTKDSVLAQNICKELTNEGYKVFFSRITLEDKLGDEYEPYIYNALMTSSVMLVVTTSKENVESVWVKNEWNRYLDKIKNSKSGTLIPCYSEMNPSELPDEFSLIQGQNMDKIGAMQDLLHGIEKLVKKSKEQKNISKEMVNQIKDMIEQEEYKDGIDTSTIDVVEEKTSIIFKLLSFGISFVLGIAYLFVFMDIGYNASAQFKTVDLFEFIYFINILVYIGAYLLGIINKKTHYYSKYMYMIAIVFDLLLYFLASTKFYKINMLSTCIFTVCNLFLLLYHPLWTLKHEKRTVPKELRNKYLEKKKKKEIYYDEFKDKYKIMRNSLGILLILLFAILMICFPPKQENGRNSSVDQIRINEAVNLREGMDSSTEWKGRLYPGEYYDILKETEDEHLVTWYYIKTEQGRIGYVNGFYAEKIEKE